MPGCCLLTSNQRDAAPVAGVIRSTCKVCGKFLGNRPAAMQSAERLDGTATNKAKATKRKR